MTFHSISAPCGDARTFGTVPNAHPNRASRGLARVKIEAGEGSVLPPKEVPVWESLIKGKRLCTGPSQRTCLVKPSAEMSAERSRRLPTLRKRSQHTVEPRRARRGQERVQK